MSRVVFVLGAGASAAAKAPLSSDFMDKAKLLLREGDLSEDDRAAFELVLQARDSLKAAHSKAELDLRNLETLFGAFEMAALFGRLGAMPQKQVEALPLAMRRLISRTIEKTMEFPVLLTAENRIPPAPPARRAGTFPKILPPVPYETFAELVARMSAKRPADVSLITFNYDLGTDYALAFAQIPFSYGLGEDPGGALDLLKLHGSLNWGRCASCGNIVPTDVNQLAKTVRIRSSDSVRLEASQRVAELVHCGSALGTGPVIVPPTWNKGMYHSQIDQVWKKAARHLSEAEYVFIIGYSYPPTDEFFRYLYALGSIGDGWVEHVYVFNPDSKVGARVKALLGPLVKSRFTALTNPFEQAISYIGEMGIA